MTWSLFKLKEEIRCFEKFYTAEQYFSVIFSDINALQKIQSSFYIKEVIIIKEIVILNELHPFVFFFQWSICDMIIMICTQCACIYVYIYIHSCPKLKLQPVLSFSSFVHNSSINEHKNMKLRESVCYEIINWILH